MADKRGRPPTGRRRQNDNAAATQLELFPERIILESCLPAQNRFRFYEMAIERDLFGSWCLTRCWGRIGSSGRLRSDRHPSQGRALDALSALAHQKRQRGYSGRPG